MFVSYQWLPGFTPSALHLKDTSFIQNDQLKLDLLVLCGGFVQIKEYSARCD